jgi:hypothetical protein
MDPNLKVYVCTRPNKRASSVRQFSDVGLAVLEHLFDGAPLSKHLENATEYYFQFPENHLNVCEVRALLRKIREKWPTKPVVILTHSEHLLTTVDRKNIGVVDTPITEGLDPQYHPNTPNIYSRFEW